MLLVGTVVTQILDESSGERLSEGRPLRSYVNITKTNGNYYLCVKNSKLPTVVSYSLAKNNLERFHSRFAVQGKLTFQFRQPRHAVLFKGEDVNMVLVLQKQMIKIMKGEHVNISRHRMPKAVPAKKNHNPFDPMSIEHIGLDRFDSRVLNMRRLSKLVLENCMLPSLPAQLGDLPVTYLSLSGSKIGPLRFNIVTFWNWMCGNTICDTLVTLKMDAINLRSLPFEIMYLKNLNTLRLADNKLEYLPHFIGELEKLKNLCVSKNLLQYFPNSLRLIRFEELDISDNAPMENIFLEVGAKEKFVDHMKKYSLHNKQSKFVSHNEKEVQKLSALSFCFLIQNQIKFKRQDIPYTLWDLYDVAARCVTCHKYVTAEYCNIFHVVNAPVAVTLIKNYYGVTHLSWQSVSCGCGHSVRSTLC